MINFIKGKNETVKLNDNFRPNQIRAWYDPNMEQTQAKANE